MGKMNGDMLMVAICQEFKWDYHTYMMQPDWFVSIIKEKMIRDNKEVEMQLKKSRRK